MKKIAIGQAIRRSEDARFLTGAGRYLDDIRLEGMARGVVVRSPHVHARVLRIDTAAAAQAPGVLCVLTGADWRAAGLGDIPTRTASTHPDGSPMTAPPRPALVVERVRFVGDAVAFVVAETLEAALDAAELVEVAYEPLPAVVDVRAAVAPGAPLVWDDVPGNVCLDYEAGDRDAVEAAFARADRVVALDLVNNRVAACPIEPRGAIGAYDGETDHLTLTASTQNVHTNRDLLAQSIFGVPPERLRIVAPDVGGGFGAKNPVYPEYALVLFAARRLGRPVKWVSGRSEGLLSDTHGRAQYSRVELALDRGGRFLAFRADSLGDLGAYMAAIGPFTPTAGTARTQGGVYRIPALHFRARAVYTHTAPVDPYRGAGRPEATYQIERLVDVAAAELGVDPVELRRRNLIRPEDLPYRTGIGHEIDSGAFETVLDRALDLAGHAGFAERAARSRARGLRRGLGVCTYLGVTGGKAQEYAGLSFERDGSATLAVGAESPGTGHETVLPQIVAGRLGIAPERIRFHQGDTDRTPAGGGHGGSRGMETAGSAVALAADKVVEATRDIAARLLEAEPERVVFADGLFSVTGTNRAVSIDDAIAAAFGDAPLPEGTGRGLGAEVSFDRGSVSYPNGCHVAEVEVDPETGAVCVLGYAAVNDFGTVVNPLLLDGQVMGGVAQGIGQALFEEIVFDPQTGQLLTGSFMDYPLPRAADLSGFRLAYYEDAPTRNNPLGVKGAGESGCAGAPPAIVNAVLDALEEDGVRHIDMPLTPLRVWQALGAARAARAGS